MRRKKPGPIADEQEVLQVFTGIMRGTVTEQSFRKAGGTEECVQVPPKISEICKAAELIGKYHGLFDRKEDGPSKGAVTEQVLGLLAELHDADAEGSP